MAKFKPGQSGNPNGRPRKTEKIEEFGKIAPEKLYELAMDEKTPSGDKRRIWQWFAEMYYGKPKESVDVTNDTVAKIEFAGVLDDWSQ